MGGVLLAGSAGGHLIPIRLYIAAGVIVASFGAGWATSSHFTRAAAARDALALSEQLRTQEAQHAAKESATLSTYAAKLKRESTASAAARSDLDRLRGALTGPVQPAGDTCRIERARIASLSQLFAESAGLSEEGGRHVEQLRADRQALIDR